MRRLAFRRHLPAAQLVLLIVLLVAHGQGAYLPITAEVFHVTNMPVFAALEIFQSPYVPFYTSPFAPEPPMASYLPSVAYQSVIIGFGAGLLWYALGLWLDRRLGWAPSPSETLPDPLGRVLAWLALLIARVGAGGGQHRTRIPQGLKAGGKAAV